MELRDTASLLDVVLIGEVVAVAWFVLRKFIVNPSETGRDYFHHPCTILEKVIRSISGGNAVGFEISLVHVRSSEYLELNIDFDMKRLMAGQVRPVVP